LGVANICSASTVIIADYRSVVASSDGITMIVGAVIVVITGNGIVLALPGLSIARISSTYTVVIADNRSVSASK